ncbi:diacylglycerol kinase [Arthrobacter sp. SW1]|uniref:diacylglycerol/lipid kinase family protein n=1 Tax=Arthrobacter sp. SW1 TaxID=1920889 RepID=UPI000877D39E|nr:diacylglycerol kinase family protein [Arthrobacter sp. SW1]OFI36944.1 diacylglycerol kinase [Arthrobacter sp. SW1]
MQAAVVINPSKSAAQDIRETITRLSAAHGLPEPLWLETTEEDPGAGQAREALEAGADVVIAAGGDGTVRCVAEVLAGTGTPLGLVPLGTGNLLARNLGMDVADMEGAAKAALLGEERKIDVVRSVRDGGSEQVFLVMAGLGFDASIMADTDSGLKDKVGWLAYVDAAIRNLAGKPVKARISVDGKPVVSRRVRSVMVGNCGKIQGGVEIFPGAAVDDGLLDLLVVAPGKLGWLGVLAGVIGKGRSKDTSVEYFQGKTMEVSLEHADDFQLDGDHEGKGSTLTVSVDPGALLVRV